MYLYLLLWHLPPSWLLGCYVGGKSNDDGCSHARIQLRSSHWRTCESHPCHMIEQSAGLSYEHRLAPRWILGIWHKIQAFVAAAKETEPVTIARIHNSTPVSNQNCVLLTQYACVSTSCPSLNDSRSTRGCVKAVESCAPAVRIYVNLLPSF